MSNSDKALSYLEDDDEPVNRPKKRPRNTDADDMLTFRKLKKAKLSEDDTDKVDISSVNRKADISKDEYSLEQDSRWSYIVTLPPSEEIASSIPTLHITAAKLVVKQHIPFLGLLPDYRGVKKADFVLYIPRRTFANGVESVHFEATAKKWRYRFHDESCDAFAKYPEVELLDHQHNPIRYRYDSSPLNKVSFDRIKSYVNVKYTASLKDPTEWQVLPLSDDPNEIENGFRTMLKTVEKNYAIFFIRRLEPQEKPEEVWISC